MHLLKLNRKRGYTLTEVMVSSAVMTLIFGALGYMVFVTGRSTFQVREQAVSQMQAASAAERITNTLRNASAFRPYSGDDMATTLTRVLYDIPDGTVPGGVRTGIVVYVPATNKNSSDGVVKIFENESAYKPGTVKSTKAPWEYNGIQDFSVVFNSPSWITISAAYNYRGFRNITADTDGDGVDDYRLAGEFLTDVIAKNHHPGESAAYAETTTTLFTL